MRNKNKKNKEDTPLDFGKIVKWVIGGVFVMNLLPVVFLLFSTLRDAFFDQTSPHDLNSLDIAVHIHSDGSADITERWDMSINNKKGTEVYKPFKLEYNQELSDYTVKMNNQPFTYDQHWDIDASRDEKAYTYGIYYDEMVWGMTDTGDNLYEVSYNISNFVTQTDTDQMIYWGFINDSMDPAPKQASVTLTSDIPINPNVNQVWGFGYEGFSEVTDNQARWWTDAPMTTSNYLVAMLKFEGSPYPTMYYRPGDFEQWLEDAFVGSDYSIHDYYNQEQGLPAATASYSASGPSLFSRLMPALIPIGFLSVFGFSGFAVYRQMKNIGLYYPSYQTLIKDSEGEYYRGELDDDVFVYAKVLDTLSISELPSYLIHAAILYLVRDGSIEMREEKDDTYISFTGVRSENPQARGFLRILENNTSNNNKYRISNEINLTQTLKVMNWQEIELWLSQVQLHSIHYLKRNGYATDIDKSVSKGRLLADRHVKLHFTDSGLALRKDLVKYRNLLVDYSLIHERNFNEVHLWDKMFIYAAALGVADEFSEQIGKIRQPIPEGDYNDGYRRIRRYKNHRRLQRNISSSYSRNVSSSSSGGSGGRSSSGGGSSAGGRSSGGGTR